MSKRGKRSTVPGTRFRRSPAPTGALSPEDAVSKRNEKRAQRAAQKVQEIEKLKDAVRPVVTLPANANPNPPRETGYLMLETSLARPVYTMKLLPHLVQNLGCCQIFQLPI